ncbi:ribonuclease R family protein [Acidicapsa dinghuensis]|uniref:Ribonuclease R n=1 Tax=Acidicapsa dinghuensis TaxID=2218256 RepID=A0ABW1EA44_9BACT|nr:RNB domain-containing ribonuclease [Acidicapsa dinghuensis]
MTDRDLLRHIRRSAGEKAGYKQLIRELGLGGGAERRQLREQLDRLTQGGELVKVDREHWKIPAPTANAAGAKSAGRGTRDNLVAGKLDLHRDGFGFVRPNVQPGTRSGLGTRSGEDDIFIPPHEINGAMQGDQVLVELDPPGRDGRRSGRIARVLERYNATVVGIFHYARSGRRGQFVPGEYRGNFVTPFDSRMAQPIVIPEGAEAPQAGDPGRHRVLGTEAQNASAFDDLEGIVVDVEITSWPTPTKPAFGRVIEILGAPDDFGVDVEMIIRKHQLPRIFPEKVLAEARSVAHLDYEEVARRVALGHDFRHLPIVTIDGETARDFDDAVYAREYPNDEWDLQVHIADVAQYVRDSTDLDLEARLRGTSVYFPDRAIPMLPHELSTDICSLKPEEDRLVLSCLMHLTPDKHGNLHISSYEVVEGVIRSAARLTYTEVHNVLEWTGPESELARERRAALVPEIERMRKLAGLLNKRRSDRGSIDFDLPEPVIEFDELGAMQGVSRAQRTWANRLIEEFMLAANECVATWLEDLSVPSLYRIHEKPDPRRVVDFEDAAAAFGYSLGIGSLPVKRFQPRGERREQQRRGRNERDARSFEIPEDIAVTPRMYQKLTARIAGKPEERILSYLMLRSLRQAKYSEVNEGHFALAAPTYTHFTSPIRRYPDLIVHRIAKALLRAGVSGRGIVHEERHASPWSHTNEGLGAKFGVRDLRKPKNDSQAHGIGSPSVEPPIPEPELAAIAAETSLTERRAAEAERELVEWKKVKFMQDRVGEEFEAVVLNPAKFGLFVELKDLFVEGLVPIESLMDDRYTYRENTREIVGVNSGKAYRAGLSVNVILDRVLAFERKLQFSIVEESILAAPPARKPKTQAGAKSKKARKQAKAAKSKIPAPKGAGKRRFPKKERR